MLKVKEEIGNADVGTSQLARERQRQTTCGLTVSAVFNWNWNLGFCFIRSAGEFDFETLVAEFAALEFGDDGVGVFGGDVDEGVALSEINLADGGGGKAGLALDGADDVVAADAGLHTDGHVKAGLALGGAAAVFGNWS